MGNHLHVGERYSMNATFGGAGLPSGGGMHALDNFWLSNVTTAVWSGETLAVDSRDTA